MAGILMLCASVRRWQAEKMRGRCSAMRLSEACIPALRDRLEWTATTEQTAGGEWRWECVQLEA
jgi:hypothetical protein